MGRSNAEANLHHVYTWDQTAPDGYSELGGAFYTPEWCEGVCVDAAEGLTQHLQSRGVRDVETVDVTHKETGKPHTVTRLGHLYVDFTRRQFEPNAEVPTVQSKEEMSQHFSGVK